MKLKRMAVIAAAAVVGPTVLMATPAMADETQNTAVTTPDAAPQDDAAPVEETKPVAQTPAVTPAEETKPAAETPADKPAAETPAVPAPVAPAAPAPAPAPAPVEKPAETPVAEHEDEDFEGDEDFVATGPVLDLKDVPATFKAGEWTKFSIAVDNSKNKPQESYVLVLAVVNEAGNLTKKNTQVEIFYNGAWHPVEIMDDGGTPVALLNEDLQIPTGKIKLDVRVKFSAGAPKGDIVIAAAGGSNTDETVWSDTVWVESKIVSGSNNGGGNNGGGNTGTKPNGGTSTTPIVDNSNNGGNTNTGGSTNTNAGGQLAETGSDAATSWALGGAGVALAMGAALVAGNGRRRRVNA
ncbi:hypothetical protein ACWDYJ_33320 [Streptomyces sp. NPDC003042]